MANNSQFEEILRGVSSLDNELRNQAEAEYEKIGLPDRMSHLMAFMSAPGSGKELHQLCALLLRRIITGSFTEGFLALDPASQHEVKNQIIESVKNEDDDVTRRKKADCLAELARKLFDDLGNNGWPEVLKFMFECINSAHLKEVPLHVLCQFPGIFGQQQSHYQNVIGQMLSQCMQPEEGQKIRFLAARATLAFLLDNLANAQLLRSFHQLLPSVIQAAQESAMGDDDSVFKSLVEISEEAPKLFRAHIELFLTVALKILSDTDREDSIRQIALESVVTLAESAPGMFRKQKVFIQDIIPQMLMLMVDLDDEEGDLEEWSRLDESEEDSDCDANAVVGENAIDRFACALGGATVLPHIMATVPPMLQHPDWRYRHAGLMAISAVGEGCHKYMEEILAQVINAVLPFLLQDVHPRVRYASCNAIGQMCTDFAPTMQKQFNEKIVPSLCAALDDGSNPRVQAHAGAALVNFVEDCPKSVLVPFLAPLCSKLKAIFNNKVEQVTEGRKLVLEQITTTIAAVADTAEEKFLPFYDEFMPTLKLIMKNASEKELRMLRGKTIECVSLIGLAVGSDKFMPDATEIMEQLLRTQADIESWEDDDPQISYMISAWARMCKLLGQRFTQYLPVVMAPLMKAASIKPEVAMFDSQDQEFIEEGDGWEVIKLGDQQSFGIKTAGLEEKATACSMLVCYARELKDGFAEYVEEVVKLMVPLVKFYFHDGVRSSAAESIPLLLECATLRGDEYVQQIWGFVAPHLLAAVKDEIDKEVQAVLMESLAKCIELRGKGCFSLEQYEELAGTLKTMLEQHFQRAQERAEKRNDEDYDEQVEEALQDEDLDDVCILSKIADILHALFSSHKSELFPFFDSLLPYYVNLLGPNRPWADRQWALCVFDDVIEFTGSESVKYKDIFVGPMLTYIEDSSPEVRQAASYGVGVMAAFTHDTYPSVIREALPRLCRVIEGPLGRGCREQLPHDCVAPVENCVSAVGKILRHQPHLLDDEALLRKWLSWLPVVEDKEEAVHVYAYVCDLIESGNPVILGDNNSNFPHIVRLLADAIYGESFEETKEVSARVVAILNQIKNASGADNWSAMLSALDQPKQIAVTNLLNDST